MRRELVPILVAALAALALSLLDDGLGLSRSASYVALAVMALFLAPLGTAYALCARGRSDALPRARQAPR
jgi:hypothetical protein